MKVVAKHYDPPVSLAWSPGRVARWASLPLLLVVLVGGLLLLSGGRPSGTLAAPESFYNFGDIPLDGGLVQTRFPLAVEGKTLVTNVLTSCMCTQARIVQGDQVSDWFGMTHDAAAPLVRVDLVPAVPAYLEVVMDPAAHGPEGAGPVERGIIVETASGQELQFVLAANILP